jgi:spermidine synthase
MDTPTHEDVKKHNMTPGDPRLSSPEFASSDRLLFLDGTVQSMYLSENVYHEALVHPAMFAHPSPKNVAILGGGEGATLREVLKHKVDSVTMIEIDAELVNICREYLPKMSNCSDLMGRSDSCFDDKLANVEYADGRAWFVDRFGPNPKIQAPPKFDVLLIDALDPEDDSEIADQLYSDENFISALVSSLTDDGVLNIQVGTAATIDDPRADMGIYKNREILFKMLEAHKDVEAMLVYEDAHCGFLEPHSFLIVCKNASCRSRWYARSDQVDYEIYDRIVRTHSKARALTYYDGTTQRSYQWPKKGWETVYCRRDPTPFECAYRALDMKAELHELDLENEDESSFRVESKKDENGKITETYVYAKTNIPKGSFIMPTHLASSLMVTSRNLDGLQKNVQVGGGRVAVIEDLLGFFDQYAHKSAAHGSAQHYVEIGGSCLIRRVDAKNEARILPSTNATA